MKLEQWIDESLNYKLDLNEKYRQLAERGEPLYDGRILFGCGYIEALRDILKELKKGSKDNELSPD